jgi:uncharacterized protein (TIGR03545 family)
MIRWSYLLPRLLIVAALGLAYWFGVNPLVRLVLIGRAEHLVHSQVEIARVDACLPRAEIRLGNVCVADPLAPMKNLFQADEVSLSLETGPLLRKRIIVDDAQLTGLQLGTDRQTPGELTGMQLAAATMSGEKLLQFVRQEDNTTSQSLFDRFAALLGKEIQQQIDELESPRLVKEMLDRWPRELQQFEARADGLKQRANVLRQSFENGRVNLPQDLGKVRQVTGEATSLGHDMEGLRADFDCLRGQAEQDRKTLSAAGQRDLQTLQDKFRLDDLNGEHLSSYLLGPELSDRLEKVAQWINWGRLHLPQKCSPPEPQRHGGLLITSFGLPPGPDYLIRQLLVDGQAGQGTDRLLFRAWLTNLTPQPDRCQQPLTLRAEVNTPAAVHISAVFDRRTAVAHDQIKVQCPGLPQPRRLLGKPEQLAIVVSPGNVELWVLLDFQGEQLTGQLVLRQTPVDLMPQLGDKYGGPKLAAILQESLSQIRLVEAVVDVSGTLQQPQWKFRTNLGPQLISGVNWMVQSQLRSRRDALLAGMQSRIQDDRGRLEQFLSVKQQALLAKLQLNQNDTQQLSQLITQGIPAVEKALGRELQAKLPDLQKKLPFRF